MIDCISGERYRVTAKFVLGGDLENLWPMLSPCIDYTMPNGLVLVQIEWNRMFVGTGGATAEVIMTFDTSRTASRGTMKLWPWENEG